MKLDHNRRCLRLAGIIFLVLGLFPSIGWAQNRLRLNVQCSHFPSAQRVVVSTNDGKPAASDVNFNVVVKVRDYQQISDLIVKKSMLPRGVVSVTVDIPCFNSTTSWTHYQVLVEQNGNRRYDPKSDLVFTEFSPRFQASNAKPMLFVSSNLTSTDSRQFKTGSRGPTNFSNIPVGISDTAKLPSFANSAGFLQVQGSIQTNAITSNLSALQSPEMPIQSIKLTEFFRSWECLNGFNSVLISLDDLKKLGKDQTRFQALRKWTCAGGNLVVFDCGQDSDGPKQVSQLLGFKAEQSNWTRTAWTPDLSPAVGTGTDGGWDYSSDVRSAKQPGKPKATKRWIQQKKMVLGDVFLIEDDMTTWGRNEWWVLLGTLTGTPDVSASLGNAKLRTYLEGFSIPGIGRPPVAVFQLLIGAFVLFIGPGMYYFCHSTGRPYLMLVAIPLFALFSVSALLTYGIFSDGFRLRGRSQSVTRVDHSCGIAVTNARSVYYCGLSPGECRFPNGAIAIDSRGEFSQPTDRTIRDEKFSITGGEIKARSPFQLTTLRSFETQQQISFISGDGQNSIGNGYDEEILLVVVKRSNQWFLAKQIPPNASATIRQVDFDLVREEVGTLARVERVEDLLTSIRGNRSYSGTISQNGYVSRTIGSLNRPDSLRAIFADSDYIAFVRNEPFVEEPMNDVDYQGDQLHLILGSW